MIAELPSELGGSAFIFLVALPAMACFLFRAFCMCQESLAGCKKKTSFNRRFENENDWYSCAKNLYLLCNSAPPVREGRDERNSSLKPSPWSPNRR